MQIARRIEEVRSEKPAAEILREAFADLGERNAAGVGGENRVWPADLLHALPKIALDGEVFGDGFDDPIAIADVSQIVVETAGGQERGGIGREEGPGILLRRGFDASFRIGGSSGQAGAPELQRWRNGRRSGIPWSRLRGRRRGEWCA